MDRLLIYLMYRYIKHYDSVPKLIELVIQSVKRFDKEKKQ